MFDGEVMNRFVLFAGLAYYPLGGWQDFVRSSSDLRKALPSMKDAGDNDWWQVVDLNSNKMICEGGFRSNDGNRKLTTHTRQKDMATAMPQSSMLTHLRANFSNPIPTVLQFFDSRL